MEGKLGPMEHLHAQSGPTWPVLPPVPASLPCWGDGFLLGRLQGLPAKFSCDTMALISLGIWCWIIELHVPPFIIPWLKLLPAKASAQTGLKSPWVKRTRSEQCWWRALKLPINVAGPNLLTFEAAAHIFVRVQSLITAQGCVYGCNFHYIT